MKHGKSRRKTSSGDSQNKTAPVRDRRIIPVNDTPLRKRAAMEFKRAMAKLDKIRAEWQRFEQEDRPSYGRWMAATFGALLTAYRENARLIDEQEDLIEEVEMEMIWSNHHNPRKAYAAVMKDRENADNDFADSDADDDGAPRQKKGSADRGHDRTEFGSEGNDGDDFNPFEEMDAEVSKEDRMAAFDDFLRSVFGINPEQMNKAEYAKMFAQFEEDFFGKDHKADPFEIHDGRKPLAGREEARVKEIYRALVRRLHPDLRADGDAKVSAIWHEVQEAYEARNLDRLETLLALTEMQGDTNGGQASLSKMRAAVEELNRGYRAIQRSIRGAKLDPAWGFSQIVNRTPLEKRIRRELEEGIHRQRRVLSNLKRTIDEWSRPWKPPVKKPRQQPKPPVKPKAGRPKPHIPSPVQAEFFDF